MVQIRIAGGVRANFRSPTGRGHDELIRETKQGHLPDGLVNDGFPPGARRARECNQLRETS